MGLRILLLTALLAGAAFAGDSARPSFVKKPMVTREGAGLNIAFSVTQKTDVEVAVLDGAGKVVRHLAAGILGENAPPPLKRDSLDQEIVWDGKDDAGKSASGPFKIRLRLGLNPKLDRILGRNDNTLSGGFGALTVGANGELYVLLVDAFRGRSELRVLDRNGKYLRTIMPYAANTPEARTETVGHLQLDGRRQPLVFNGQAHSFYPLVAGIREQTMAWHPDGYLLAASSIGSMCNHGPPRHLIAFHPEGGAPEKTGHVGPLIRKPIGFMGGAGEGSTRGCDRLAVSPKGEWIYFVHDMKMSWAFAKEREHGVYRLKWTDKDRGTLWLGRKEPGAGDDEFNDPQGLAVDKEGQLYVCDRENNRIKVYSPEGKLLGKIPCPLPEQIAVHPASGEIYVLSRKGDKANDLIKSAPITSAILKFAAWKNDEPKEIARLEFKVNTTVAELMALDASAAPPRLWVALYRKGLFSITDEGAALKMGDAAGEPGGLHYPNFIAADPARNRIIVVENGAGHWVMNLETGQRSSLKITGSDLALDKDGNMYVIGPYASNALLRFDPEGKPLPFPATGSNKLDVQKLRAYGPSLGLRGHCVAPNGDIYLRRSPDHACVATVDVWGADGTLRKAGLVNGAGSGDSGIGVDNQGNIYLGMNLKPADKPIPDDFAAAVPALPWRYYRTERPAPWNLVYANPYLFHMGAIFKFGPEGGNVYGNFDPKAKFIDENLGLSRAPADAEAFKSAYLRWDVKVAGAKFSYRGIGIVPQSFDAFTGDDGCECLQSHLDVDPYGRVYAPSAFHSSVEMIDSAGNRIARIGAYGNADSGGPASKLPAPEIAFAWPAVCDYAEADGRLYVSDSVNRRIMVIRFDAAASETCDVR